MTIFIGADHRGYELKNQVIEYLQEKNIRVEDMGNLEKDPHDDYVDFAKKVAEAVLQNPSEFIGIVICASGVGVDITANRYKGIRSGLGFDIQQVKFMREDDQTNILALPAEFIDFEKTKDLIDTFITTQPKTEEKYQRRIRKIDAL